MNTPNEFQTHVRTLGDTRTAMGAILKQGGQPIDLTELTVSVVIEQHDGDAEQAITASGVTKQPPYSVTLDTANNWIVCNGHPFTNGMQLLFGGTLTSTGLAASTRYFVQQAEDNCFRVSLTRSGAAITIAAAGSAVTAKIVGSVSYDFTSGNTDTAGNYWLWFVVSDGDETDTFPHDGKKRRVEIVDPGFGA